MNDLPFSRGDTYFNGATVNTTDGANLEGKEYMIEDTANGTGMYVTLRAVRNNAAFVLTPKRLIQQVTGLPGQTNGYAFVNPQNVLGVVDDQYTNTIPVSDVFWAVVHGPCLVKSPLEGDVTNSVGVDTYLVNTTGATSGATTSGRLCAVTLGGATSPLALQILNSWGRALSAKTTANTNTDTLCMVGKVY